MFDATWARGQSGGGRGQGRGRFGCGNGAGGRGGRMFDNGDLRLLIMALLGSKPRHGYEVIKALEEQVGGGYSPSPGVIYPTLTLLEELGHATVDHAAGGQAAGGQAKGGRKLYTLTAEGAAALAASRAALDAILARLADGAATRGPPPPIVRAMENLGTAVRLRLAGPPMTQEQIKAMAAAIDQTARTVEDI
jgi:DNA-binding PadR family transcriptional regulator